MSQSDIQLTYESSEFLSIIHVFRAHLKDVYKIYLHCLFS